MVSVCSDSPAALELAAAVGEALDSGAEACGEELSGEADCVGLAVWVEGSSLALPAVVLPQPASAKHPNRTVSEPNFSSFRGSFDMSFSALAWGSLILY